eukprot:scaffold314762_cov32-Tisochrysis_lutea.AAC.2
MQERSIHLAGAVSDTLRRTSAQSAISASLAGSRKCCRPVRQIQPASSLRPCMSKMLKSNGIATMGATEDTRRNMRSASAQR